MNGPVYKQKYGIQLKYFLPGGLVFFGFLSFLLSVTGLCLVKNNERKGYKYISGICSFIMCVGLIYAGNYTIWTANNVENQVELFCDGGFPKLTDLSKTLIQNMIDAEFHHITRYMCNTEYCPCSSLVDKIKFGDRASEFQYLSNAGSVKKYFRDCYPKVTTLENNKAISFSKDFLKVLEMLEVTYDCGGVCETPLFYFFKTSTAGPPPRNCRPFLIKYFKQ